jgi:hypothetical protein
MARHRKLDSNTALTREALETLLEIRLGCVEVYDREDARELKQLEKTRDQLNGMLGIGTQKPPAQALTQRERIPA